MGLDMYAISVPKPGAIDDLTNLGSLANDYTEILLKPTDRTIIWEWRKHPNLHGWMQKRYAVKTGVNEPEKFNRVSVGLTSDDLKELERDISAGALPHTEGFFFGQSMTEEVENDLSFIGAARQEIARGKLVYYTSWW